MKTTRKQQSMRGIFAITVFLGLIGCTNHAEVIALQKEITELKQQQAQQQAEKEQEQAANKERQDNLALALNEADSQRLECRVVAERERNADVKANGMPDPDHKGYFTGNKDEFKNIEEKEARADADCQHEYEDAVQTARILYGPK